MGCAAVNDTGREGFVLGKQRVVDEAQIHRIFQPPQGLSPTDQRVTYLAANG